VIVLALKWGNYMIAGWGNYMIVLAFRWGNYVIVDTRGPRPVLLPEAFGRRLVDHAAISSVLRSSLLVRERGHNISDEAEKGKVFEATVGEYLASLGTNVWALSKALRQRDDAGTESEREFDVCFVAEDVMFVCELRSINRSLGSEIGSSESLAFRQEKMAAALCRVDTAAQWLARFRKGLNYEIPREVKCLVPLVVSPFTEYIWSRAPELWLTEDTPRICVPRELPGLTKNEALRTVKGGPFAVPIRE
jgi:hypothetical protein